MNDIQGVVLLSRFEYLEKKLGAQAVSQLVKKLPEHLQHSVQEQIFPVNRYPFQLVQEIDALIPQLIAEPLEQIFREIGTMFAQNLIEKYFFNYLESKDPAKLISQIGNLYGYLWGFGQYHVVSLKNGEARVDYIYEMDIHKPYCWFTQEFLIKGLQMCCGSSVSITELMCAAETEDRCSYKLIWEK